MKKKSRSSRFWHCGVNTGNILEPDKFHYTDPQTGEILLVQRDEDYIKETLGEGLMLKRYFDRLRYGTQRLENPLNGSGLWMWRRFILPGFPEESMVSMGEGNTPLFKIPEWFAKEIGLKNLSIKQESRSPSESFKDRGMPVAISDTLRLQSLNPDFGIKGVCCASTGDTLAAAAAYSAYCRDRISCLGFLPYEKITDSHLFQAEAHGATVIALKHPRGFDGCMDLIVQFQKTHPEYVLVNSKNDMRVVGQETIILEILQDLRWKGLDWVAIPVGNAGNLAAMLNSLLRAKEFGLIDRLPGIIAAQTKSADTLVRWQKSGYKKYKPGVFKDTVASAMNINDPVSFPRIKSLYEKFDIRFYAAEELEINQTWARFMKTGVNICPQSAVPLCAIMHALREGVIKENDVVVSIATASMLKHAEAGITWHKSNQDPSCNPYRVVGGTLAEIEAELKK